ncbi:Cysteine/Histidine-rich C1 domain family protein [Quillaja saponaria]|uniref:Cysteine/Histidine-rich C1 domain family protein n=1 Tax=Quillaja saponaria TaxID=32244 RepID=A0AAD7M1Y6_QUISA|nr:Cysteine/Histidine-rich C1 domain family protein [Quillaja saponaria]
METHHSSHPEHPLFLYNEINDMKDEALCSKCTKPVGSGQTYACNDCKFYLHKDCTDVLPGAIKHPYHPQCLLKLWFYKYGGFECDSCHRIFNREERFRCNKCDFDMDIGCALMPTIKSESHEEEENNLQYFRHQHQLQLIIGIKNAVACFVCHEPCLQGQPIYGCIPCDCFAHKSCAQLPIQIQHPFHPSHQSLTLTPRRFPFRCHHCQTRFSTFRFYCEETEFRLCLKCFPLKPYRSGAEELLPEIKNPFSPESLLVLQGNKDFWCDSCHKFFSTDWCYWSQECQMDIHCALMPPIIEKGDQGSDHVIRHCGHQHPLTFMEMKNDEDFQQVHCFVCRQGFLQGQSTYGCKRCECYAHKSCAELPSERQHLFHTRHPLVLRSGQYQEFRCNFCVSLSSSFRYHCKQCDFNLCLKCCYVKPTIHYKSHPHALFFMEKIFEKDLYCNECKKSIKAFANEDDEYFPTQNCAFRCKECDFNLHLLCGPLPCKIEHEDHGHPLTYTDRAVEDDSGVYYCGLCQEERDPRVQVYWCADCKYIADVKCVISEVEIDGVGFRAVGEPTEDADVNMKALDSTLANIMENLSKDDEQELNVLLAPLRVESEDKVTPNEVQQEHDYRKDYLPYTDKDLHQLMGRLCSACLTNNSKEMVISNREFEQNLVVVGGYMISWKLVPVLKELLGKYKNFTPDNSNFTPEVKAVCIFFLCWVVNSMRKETIVYVTETKLAYWWYYLNALLHKGFKIDFLIEHLKRVIQAYFGLQAIKQSKEIVDSLNIESILASSVQKRNKLTEKLQKLQEDHKQYETYMTSRRPRLIQKCLKEAFELQWSYADCEVIDHTYSAVSKAVRKSASTVMEDMTLRDLMDNLSDDEEIDSSEEQISEAVSDRDIPNRDLQEPNDNKELSENEQMDFPEPPTKEAEIKKESYEEQSKVVRNDGTSDEDQQEPNNHNNEFSPYTVQDYDQLMERLQASASVEELWEDSEFLEQKIVDIGGYLITLNFAPILKDLITKYGDFSKGLRYRSPKYKAVFFSLLCWSINSMRKTWVIHVTEELLGTWLVLLNFVKKEGLFKIEFILDRLTRVIQAHFGFEIARRDHDILQTLNRNIMSISRELNNLEYEAEKECRMLYEQHKASMALQKSSLMENCLEEANQLKWTSALPNL